MHYENSVEWVKNLVNLTEEQWRAPIAKGKWSLAEVIGHFPAWDQFVIEKRLPYLLKKEALPKEPNVDEVNHQSSIESKMKTKEEIISKFIGVRRSLIIAINNIEDDLWEKKVKIGSKTMTLTDYLKGTVEHDEHHFKQIQKILDSFDIGT